MSIEGKILRELQFRPRRFRELKDRLGDERKLRLGIGQLTAQGKIHQENGVYMMGKAAPTQTNGAPVQTLPCTIVKLAPRFGFASRDDGEGDVFIPGRALRGAMPGDKVQVHLFEHPRVEGSVEGEVMSIDTPNNSFVGTVATLDDGRLVLEPDRCGGVQLIIKKSADGGVQPGEKAAVVILDRGERHSSHRVGVAMRFGSADSAKQCARAMLYGQGLDKHFPDKVKAEARPLEGAKVSEEQMKGRLDLRALPIFTIDSAETKDIDDAVSLHRTSDNGYELGVHIADVSNYVRPKTELDAEAFNRATSVYYADSVIPMLPRALSNGICSLNENEVRLAFSCLVKLDAQGEIVDYHFAKSVIRSRVKGVYKEINALVDGTAGEDLTEKYAAVSAQLPLMKELYEKRTALRRQRGGIEFSTSESKLVLDKEGVCVDVVKRDRGLSECMIEEFMLLANQCAANLGRTKGMPFLYRVHESPAPERVERLREMLKAIGVDPHFAGEIPTQKEIADLLDRMRGSDLEYVVNTSVLRSMAKARYEAQPKGHFGLGLEDYAHFTSPIRRYPDLAIHRIMTDYLAGISVEELKAKYTTFAQTASEQSTRQEITAMQVERGVEDCYKAEYLRGRLGEDVEGIISGVTQYGVYVQLPNTVEGMVRVAELCANPVVTEGLRISDPLSGKSWMLGDRMRVTVARADVSHGQVDFMPAKAVEE